MTETPKTGAFGPYTLHRDLGPGESSHFYRAEHPDLGVVRLEVFHPEAREDSRALHRHWRQSQLVGRLDHPNLIQILDSGTLDGQFYLATEAFDGRPLSALLRENGPFPADAAIPLMTQVLHALDYAHKNDFLHEDLRPEDVLLGPMNRAKLQGFGRLPPGTARGEGEAPSLKDRLANLDGFSAPEQVLRSQLPDPSTDVYRAGALLYWMVTGELPFELEISSKDPEELAEALLATPPFVPSSVHNAVPWELDRVILKAMEKRPGARFRTAGFMLSALEMVQRGELTWIRLEGRVRYAEWPWLLRMVVLVIILQIAYLIIFDPAKLIAIRVTLFS